MESEEMLPIVDSAGNIIDASPRCICHDGKSMLLHPVVHLHVVNSSGCLLLQKRSVNKLIQPGKWDTGVGGHVSLGESADVALHREASEEIGLNLTISEKMPELMSSYVFRSSVESELVCSYIYFCNDSFSPSISEPDQIEQLKFFSKQEIEQLIAQGETTPNFEEEYRSIVNPYLSQHEF